MSSRIVFKLPHRETKSWRFLWSWHWAGIQTDRWMCGVSVRPNCTRYRGRVRWTPESFMLLRGSWIKDVRSRDAATQMCGRNTGCSSDCFAPICASRRVCSSATAPPFSWGSDCWRASSRGRRLGIRWPRRYTEPGARCFRKVTLNWNRWIYNNISCFGGKN